MHSYKVTSLVHIDPGRHIDIQTGNSVVCTIKNKKKTKKTVICTESQKTWRIYIQDDM